MRRVVFAFVIFALILLAGPAFAQKTLVDGIDTTGPNTFTQPQSALAINGRVNEAVFSQGTLAQRLTAACAQFNGKIGIVEIPVTETDTSFAPPAVIQEGCIIQDDRGIVIPGSGGFTISTGTSAPRSLFFYNQRNTATSFCCTDPGLLTLYMEANAGGFNTWNGVTGTKTNYNPLNVDLLGRTPGQHIGINSQVFNFSGQGDTIAFSAVAWCNGSNNAGGDEGCKLYDGQAFTGLGITTGTVVAINGSTLTLTCGTNCNQLGEQTALVVTSRATYTTGTASIAGTPPTITGAGTTWSSVCSGPTSSVFFRFNSEPGNMLVPASSCASNTTINLALVGEGANVNYQGNVTSGAYTLFKGSTITAVPYTSGVYNTIYATVADPSQFHVGDSVSAYGAPQSSVTGVSVNVVANVPFNPNSAGDLFHGQSTGLYPVGTGIGLFGRFYTAPYYGSWVGYDTTPIYGSYLKGVQPSNSFYYANDPAQNNTERILGTSNSSGVTHYISYDRTGGNNEWGMDALSVGTNGAAVGNVIHGSANTTFSKYVSSGNSPTYTADRTTYGANPNNAVWMSFLEIPGGKVWGIQSSGSGAQTAKLGMGTGLNFYSDNMSTQTAGINAATGMASFMHLNQQANHDIAGTIAIASATSASASFASAYGSAPICTLTPTSDTTSAGAWWVSTSTSAVTANVKNSATVTFNYSCTGNPN